MVLASRRCMRGKPLWYWFRRHAFKNLVVIARSAFCDEAISFFDALKNQIASSLRSSQ